MNEVSTLRLYLLRGTYLLLVVGLGIDIWPGIIRHSADLGIMSGTVRAVLGTVALLALVGLRHPMRMLPLLLFELVWKTIWLIAFAWPMWRGHHVDAAARESIKACLLGVVIFTPVLPWPYVWRHFVRQAGEPWKRAKVGG